MISNDDINFMKLIIARLERLSADSLWARRASGCRGALLKLIEDAESRPDTVDAERLRGVMDWALSLLARGAKELVS